MFSTGHVSVVPSEQNAIGTDYEPQRIVSIAQQVTSFVH
jgi:hypothetical protein